MRSDLKECVIEALTHSGDDPGAAVDIIVEWSAHDPSLRDRLLRLGAQQVVRTYYNDQRESAMTMAIGRVAASLDNPDVAQRVAARIARKAFWDKYTLYGHIPLKGATKAQLLESIGNRRAQITSEQRNLNFEQLIADRLPDDDARVSDHLTEAQVERLANKAMGVKQYA